MKSTSEGRIVRAVAGSGEAGLCTLGASAIELAADM
jgi:hypothetical protein